MFLEKLFRFSKEQKIERISAGYGTAPFDDSIKTFKIIIEKKTTEEKEEWEEY